MFNIFFPIKNLLVVEPPLWKKNIEVGWDNSSQHIGVSMGVPPVIIHFERWDFPVYKKQPLFGLPPWRAGIPHIPRHQKTWGGPGVTPPAPPGPSARPSLPGLHRWLYSGPFPNRPGLKLRSPGIPDGIHWSFQGFWSGSHGEFMVVSWDFMGILPGSFFGV